MSVPFQGLTEVLTKDCHSKIPPARLSSTQLDAFAFDHRYLNRPDPETQELESMTAQPTISIGDSLRGAVHPVILLSGDADYPYYGVGTAFILKHEDQFYAISAAHVFTSQEAAEDQFCLLTPKGKITVQFDRAMVFKTEPGPEHDLMIRRILPSQRDTLFAAGIEPLDSYDTLEERFFDGAREVAVVGYPEQARDYDYEKRLVSAQIYTLMSVPAQSNVPGLQATQASGRVPMSMRGMSGSIVVAFFSDGALFAGMAIMASEATGLVHFIPGSRIVDYLDAATAKERRNEFLDS